MCVLKGNVKECNSDIAQIPLTTFTNMFHFTASKLFKVNIKQLAKLNRLLKDAAVKYDMA